MLLNDLKKQKTKQNYLKCLKMCSLCVLFVH